MISKKPEKEKQPLMTSYRVPYFKDSKQLSVSLQQAQLSQHMELWETCTLHSNALILKENYCRYML